jgi:pyruvate dehydrogenase E1 component
MADPDAVRAIEDRVLWLATSIVQAANSRLGDTSGLKVGGHQASSASLVSVMTALWTTGLTAHDRVSVKPHASPVLHAINYLLGLLDEKYMPLLRDYGGLQPYPSRTKDPDSPDYSTGSVGIGATAPVWGAIARRYLRSHLESGARGRHISILGDAELDEGAIWECVADRLVASLGEVLWIVDLNRQSLDRVVPGVAARKWQGMFAAAGWEVIEVKYGSRLRELFARENGQLLRDRLDGMPNEEYQGLLRAPAERARALLCAHEPALKRAVEHLEDGEVAAAVADLGGHDAEDLARAFAAASQDRPTVVFAYTIKGRGLPTAGHPANHSALLTASQYREMADRLGMDPDDPWRRFAADSREGRVLAAASDRLRRQSRSPTEPPAVPPSLGRAYRGSMSTQDAFGRVLTELARAAPEVAARVVTVSPDVATSTNAGGWINKVGVWSPEDGADWFADDPDRVLRWRESVRGQHIELGIAEVNLVGLLGELGATWLTEGEPLLPIGTVYDPFVTRALEPWIFGTYAGGQSVLVGTPSGVTLASEGGAHQSVITPSIGMEQPGVTYYEPAFAQEVEWCLLDALSRLGRPDGESSYLRLSTRPVDQSASAPSAAEEADSRRQDVLAGGYTLARADGPPVATIAAMGAAVPEAIAALDQLTALGLHCDLVVVTSPDRLYRAFLSRRGQWRGCEHGIDERHPHRLLPPDRRAPLVTVLDGAPHTLAFLGTLTRTRTTTLGVTRLGRAGSLADVLRLHAIDARAIVEAVLDLVDP